MGWQQGPGACGNTLGDGHQPREGVGAAPATRRDKTWIFKLGNRSKVSSVSTPHLEQGQEGQCLLQSCSQH